MSQIAELAIPKRFAISLMGLFWFFSPMMVTFTFTALCLKCFSEQLPNARSTLKINFGSFICLIYSIVQQLCINNSQTVDAIAFFTTMIRQSPVSTMLATVGRKNSILPGRDLRVNQDQGETVIG